MTSFLTQVTKSDVLWGIPIACREIGINNPFHATERTLRRILAEIVTEGVLCSSDAELEHNEDLGIFSRSAGNPS